MKHHLRGKSPLALARDLGTACFLATALFLSHPASSTAQETILHDFDPYDLDGISDGATPYGSLTLSGSTLYGMTYHGGVDDGVVFSMGADGTNFTTLHDFTTASTDGDLPMGSLTLSGSTLYGLTSIGGSNNQGALFSIGTNGSSFTLLHSFATATDGSDPVGSLTLSGTTLYGLTSSGGSGSQGTAFSVGLDGSNFTLLHSFAGGATDGQGPTGSLILSGSKLYGMAPWGGANNDGVAYSMNLDGSGFTLLHSFDSTSGDHPHGSLTLLGSKLYGMTAAGSTTLGTIFSMNLDGSGYQILYQLSGTGSQGAEPLGSLVAFGTKLFGMANYGGSGNGAGTAFSINSDGTGFTLLQNFAAPTTDGGAPEADLTLSTDGQTLYGMTPGGGTNNYGVVFSLPSGVPEPTGLALLTLGAVLCTTRRRPRHSYSRD